MKYKTEDNDNKLNEDHIITNCLIYNNSKQICPTDYQVVVPFKFADFTNTSHVHLNMKTDSF